MKACFCLLQSKPIKEQDKKLVFTTPTTQFQSRKLFPDVQPNLPLPMFSTIPSDVLYNPQTNRGLKFKVIAKEATGLFNLLCLFACCLELFVCN
jgi:hypothetical protein